MDGHLVRDLRALHHARDAIHPVAAEQPHEIVFQREVELREPRIALATGPTAQLVVDAPRVVPLGADDSQTAGGDDLLVFLSTDPFRVGERLRSLLLSRFFRLDTAVAKDLVDEKLRVATEDDIRAAACHVGGDGDGALASGLGDDVRLHLVELGVQHVVRDSTLLEQA